MYMKIKKSQKKINKNKINNFLKSQKQSKFFLIILKKVLINKY